MHILDQTLYTKATFYKAASESYIKFSPDQTTYMPHTNTSAQRTHAER